MTRIPRQYRIQELREGGFVVHDVTPECNDLNLFAASKIDEALGFIKTKIEAALSAPSGPPWQRT